MTSSIGRLGLLLQLVTVATANTYVNIHMPTILYKKDGYTHKLGDFGSSAMALTSHAGHEAYGSMSLQVYLAPTDLCHHINDTASTPYEAPFLLLATRGNCTFVTKTRRAQHMGAAGLLIADDLCVCSDGDACIHADTPCQAQVPAVADDGSGGDVTIPTLLLRKQDGLDIQTQLVNQTVLVSLRWEPPSPNNTAEFAKVDYGMALDLMDPHTPGFMASIKHIALAVGKEANFYPSYMIYSGTQHCARDVCTNTCINQGRYCYPHFKGVDVVNEILRRLCIWKHHGDTANDRLTGLEGEAFWNYVEYFDNNCAKDYFVFDADEKKNEACIEKAFKRARVTNEDVQLCILDSGDPMADIPNTVLEEHLKGLAEYGVFAAPSIWVSNTTLPRTWRPPTPTGLLQALCNGFKTQGAPRACQKCLGPKLPTDQDVIQCALNYYEDNYKYPHRHVWRTFFLFLLILAGGAMGYVIHRRQQDGMDLTTDSLFNPLQGYVPLIGRGVTQEEGANGIVQEQTIDFQ